jgi:TetR/AcrR family fatty acid metabolism transcriptional regulator
MNEPSFSSGQNAAVTTVARDLQKQDKRARIVDAAVHVFAEHGFFNATIAQIAREAGVADGTIYLYFKSKDELLFRLFDEKMSALLEEAKGQLAKEPDAPSRLTRFIHLHFALVEKSPALASVLIVELRQSAQLLKQLEKDKLSAYLELIAETVRTGQGKGELIGGIAPGTVKRALFGALDESALAWLLSGRKSSLKKTAAEVATLFVRGLLPANSKFKFEFNRKPDTATGE